MSNVIAVLDVKSKFIRDRTVDRFGADDGIRIRRNDQCYVAVDGTKRNRFALIELCEGSFNAAVHGVQSRFSGKTTRNQTSIH